MVITLVGDVETSMKVLAIALQEENSKLMLEAITNAEKESLQSVDKLKDHPKLDAYQLRNEICALALGARSPGFPQGELASSTNPCTPKHCLEQPSFAS